MPIVESLAGPLASIIDKIIPDKAAREKAKLELLQLEGSQELQRLEAQMTLKARRGLVASHDLQELILARRALCGRCCLLLLHADAGPTGS